MTSQPPAFVSTSRVDKVWKIHMYFSLELSPNPVLRLIVSVTNRIGLRS